MHANGRKTYHQMFENNTWVVGQSYRLGEALVGHCGAPQPLHAQTSFSDACIDG